MLRSTLVWSIAAVIAPAQTPLAKPAADTRTAVTFVWNVYHLTPPATAPLDVLRAHAKQHYPGLRIVEKLPREASPPPMLWAHVVDRETNPPPDRRTLKLFGRGMTGAQIEAMQKSSQSVALGFFLPAEGTAAAQHRATKLVHALAAATDGFIWDDESREMFPASVWRERRLDGWQDDLPELSRHFVVHMYPNGELMRLVSLGLGKFGLPDLAIEGAPRANMHQLNTLMNLVAQTMLEQHAENADALRKLRLDIDKLRHGGARERIVDSIADGAERRLEVRLTPRERQDGDADNALLAIGFGGVEGESETERQSTAIEKLFGASEDPVQGVTHDDAVRKASAKARAHAIAALKPKVQKGLAPKERVMVKGPFETTTGGNEWMWVEVTRWQDKVVHGILLNEPRHCPGLRHGSKVTVEEGKIFDYLHQSPTGEMTGNSTAEVLQRKRRGE